MKQFITQQQLKELSPTEYNTLAVWCRANKNFRDMVNEGGYTDEPFMDIQLMLEFLDECFQFPQIKKVPGECEHVPDGFQLEFYVSPKKNKQGSHPFGYQYKWYVTNEELCDALWEAIKVVLRG